MLLHAFPLDARMWNGSRALLEEQARVITPDQRGLGESPLPDASGEDEDAQLPGVDVAAADVLALLDVMGVQQFVVGGCSMGGYVAMALLRAAPERVTGALLVDTKADADGAEQRKNRIEAADRAEREGTEGWLADNSLPNVLGSTTRESRPDLVAEVRDVIETQDPGGVAWAQRAMAARPDSRSVLREFTGPALVVVGEQDSMTRPEDAHELAVELPAGEFAMLPEAGHLSPLEAPEAFADVVAPWLNRIT
ncbi:alpha/beta fold hydrolase [Parasphingorhabdus pacifica]